MAMIFVNVLENDTLIIVQDTNVGLNLGVWNCGRAVTHPDLR